MFFTIRCRDCAGSGGQSVSLRAWVRSAYHARLKLMKGSCEVKEVECENAKLKVQIAAGWDPDKTRSASELELLLSHQPQPPPRLVAMPISGSEISQIVSLARELLGDFGLGAPLYGLLGGPSRCHPLSLITDTQIGRAHV